jgi:hypothetical protein
VIILFIIVELVKGILVADCVVQAVGKVVDPRSGKIRVCRETRKDIRSILLAAEIVQLCLLADFDAD